MSAFLGPIHLWLFKKIKLQNTLINEIYQLSLNEGWIKKDALDCCGILEDGELSEIIDDMNIHGWLQERVDLVEYKLAYLLKLILIDRNRLPKVLDISYKLGVTLSPKTEINALDGYKYLDTILLNGMPCDHVLKIISKDENMIRWGMEIDIHKPYYEEQEFDVSYYYQIRNALIKGVFASSNLKLTINNDFIELRKE